ncbi:hypothetical protein Tco_0641359 [Tanacetum coccineum]
MLPPRSSVVIEELPSSSMIPTKGLLLKYHKPSSTPTVTPSSTPHVTPSPTTTVTPSSSMIATTVNPTPMVNPTPTFNPTPTVTPTFNPTPTVTLTHTPNSTPSPSKRKFTKTSANRRNINVINMEPVPLPANVNVQEPEPLPTNSNTTQNETVESIKHWLREWGETLAEDDDIIQRKGDRAIRKMMRIIFAEIMNQFLISKVKNTKTWEVKTYTDEHKCLQSREIHACTSKFLSKGIVEQIEKNLDIPIRALQDELQKKYELGVSRMKAFKAKSAALNQVKGDYRPLKKGFKACGRDLLGLDVAFMKGPYPGQLLTTMGLDGNNGIYPLAYAIVEKETTLPYFDREMEELKQFNKEAFEWLAKIPAHTKLDILLNNLCECFNGKILDARGAPIITALEYIMEYLMRKMVNVIVVINKTNGPLTPGATKLLKVAVDKANKYTVGFNGGKSMRMWELTGIPCAHAIATNYNMALNRFQVGLMEEIPNSYNTHPTQTSHSNWKAKKKRKTKEEKAQMVKDGKMSRAYKTMTCTKCGNLGHNSISCNGQKDPMNETGTSKSQRSTNVAADTRKRPPDAGNTPANNKQVITSSNAGTTPAKKKQAATGSGQKRITRSGSAATQKQKENGKSPI